MNSQLIFSYNSAEVCAGQYIRKGGAASSSSWPTASVVQTLPSTLEYTLTA